MTEIRKTCPGAPLKPLCSVFDKSRQAYYKRIRAKTRLERKEQRIIQLVREIRQKLPLIGGRKLCWMLKDSFHAENIRIGRDKFFDILRKHGELVFRKRRFARTTNSRHHFTKYKNIVKDLNITHPEQVFVSDITYIPQAENMFAYAAFTTDAFSRKIMGFSVSDKLDSSIVTDAIIMAINNRKYDAPLIHHSDRGVQFCSNEFTNILKANNIAISMTETGDPRENPIAERINGIIKNEFGLDTPVQSTNQAKSLAAQAVLLYNNMRPHMSCQMRTPAQAHASTSFAHVEALISKCKPFLHNDNPQMCKPISGQDTGRDERDDSRQILYWQALKPFSLGRRWREAPDEGCIHK